MTVDYQRVTYLFDDEAVREASVFVTRTGVPALIRQWQAEDGFVARQGRLPRFTLEAVQTALHLIVSVTATVTIAEILRVIYRLTDVQLAMVGMVITDDQRRDFLAGTSRAISEDARFRDWLRGQLDCLDAYWDMPAKMLENGEYRRRIDGRTEADRQRAAQRVERGSQMVNALLRASIDAEAMAGWQGDLLADETLIDVATVRAGMGAKDLKLRSAVSRSDFYVRTQTHETIVRADGLGSRRDIVKLGFAVGITAVHAVGPMRAPGLVPRPIIAMEIGKPTAGDGDALIRCLERLPSLAIWPQTGRRLRLVATDMGYIGKPRLSNYLLEHGIGLIHAYPQRRGKAGRSQESTYVLPADWPTPEIAAQKMGMMPGPILAWGEWYCPAARALLAENPTRRRREIGETRAGYDAHDRMLAERSPYAMGRLARPQRSDTKRAGRREDEEVDLHWKMRLQCPAEQGRVRCPLKAESMGTDLGIPTANPTWPAERFQCCHSEVTVTMTDRQVTSLQLGPPPGSFEHQAVLETYRARTESRFAHLKHPSVSGLKRMSVGPRRDPLMLLQIGTAVAISNLRLQREFRPDKRDVIRIYLAKVDRILGRRATRKPHRS